MKNQIGFLLTVVCASFLTVSQAISAPPPSGDFTVVGQNEYTVKFSVADRQTIIVEMPVLSDQKDLPSQNWTAACSYAFFDGKFRYKAQRNYDIPTSVSGYWVRGTLTVPEGVRYVWPRCWGHNFKNPPEHKSLWIDQYGPFTRKSGTGKISYESVADMYTGEVVPVPGNYPLRK